MNQLLKLVPSQGSEDNLAAISDEYLEVSLRRTQFHFTLHKVMVLCNVRVAYSLIGSIESLDCFALQFVKCVNHARRLEVLRRKLLCDPVALFKSYGSQICSSAHRARATLASNREVFGARWTFAKRIQNFNSVFPSSDSADLSGLADKSSGFKMRAGFALK